MKLLTYVFFIVLFVCIIRALAIRARNLRDQNEKIYEAQRDHDPNKRV
jgi:hypothetical protein